MRLERHEGRTGLVLWPDSTWYAESRDTRMRLSLWADGVLRFEPSSPTGAVAWPGRKSVRVSVTPLLVETQLMQLPIPLP